MEEGQFIREFELLFDEVVPSSITKDTVIRDLDEWSSLMALAVIAMVDDNGMKLSGTDIRDAVTVGDLYARLTEKPA